MLIRKKNKKGSTIISLMLGITLGGVLISGVLQVFLASRMSYTLVDNIVELNSSMAYAVHTMRHFASYTGFTFPYDENIIPNFCTTFPSFNNYLAPTYLSPNRIDTNSDGYRDDPTFLFQADGNQLRDITGMLKSDGIDIYTRFSSQQPSSDPGSVDLEDLYGFGVGTGHPITTNYMPIVSKLVEGMWVNYGYDTNNDGVIEYYYRSNAPYSNRIRSIKIALLLHSRDEVLPEAIDHTFHVFDTKITKNDKHIYKMEIITVPLVHVPVPIPNCP